MLLEILQKVNLLDILIFLLFLRTISIALQKGFAIELFKLLGYLLATYLALHYYTICSDLAGKAFGLRMASVEFLDFFCFILLAFLGYNFFVLVRFVFVRKHPAEQEVSSLTRWGGAALGVIRGVLMNALIIVGLVASTFGYFKTQVAESFMGRALFDVSPVVYYWTWHNLTSTVSGDEQINPTVKEVQKSVSRHSRTQGEDDDS